MKFEDVKTVAVMGAGLMGHGIAELALMSGYKVAVRDIKQEFVDRGINNIKDSLVKLYEKKKITENPEDMMKRLSGHLDIESAVKNADFVLEAVPEIWDLKVQTFKEMDKYAPKNAILASNTSNMSITGLGDATSRPDKVVGMHFFSPPVIMKLVEVIRGGKTSNETMDITSAIGEKWNKVVVRVEKDTPGFIYNRVGAPAGLYMSQLIDRGVHTPEGVDAFMKKNFGVPMAPYELMDFVGIDVSYHGMRYFNETLGPDYKPGKFLTDLFNSGKLGAKTKGGIYDWSAGRPAIDLNKADANFDFKNVVAVQCNEGTKLIEMGVAKDSAEVDKALANGGGGGVGPFALAKMLQMTPADMCQRLEKIARDWKMATFWPTSMLMSGNIK